MNSKLITILENETTNKQFSRLMPANDAARFAQIAIAEINRNEKLLECDPKTIIERLMQCAELGLEPSSNIGHAYIIPFNNRRKQTTECQLIFGYKGLLDLARRSNEISRLDAQCVYKNDFFEYEQGTSPYIKHKPSLSNRGIMIAVYACATFKGGVVQFDVMSAEEINDHRAKYSIQDKFKKYNKETIWDKHYEEMAKKTILRRLCKLLPSNPKLRYAINIEDDEYRVIDGEYANSDECKQLEQSKIIIEEINRFAEESNLTTKLDNVLASKNKSLPQMAPEELLKVKSWLESKAKVPKDKEVGKPTPILDKNGKEVGIKITKQ